MELDKTTYLDLSIFNREDEYSLFHKLDFTTYLGRKGIPAHGFFSNPLERHERHSQTASRCCSSCWKKKTPGRP